MHDVFLCDGVRTPIGRYGGVLAGVRTDDLAAFPIQQLMGRYPDLDWGVLDDVILGCANQAGEDNRNVARMAALLCGLEGVPGLTVNRLCASGLEATAHAYRSIAIGEADLIVAGGVESMSRAPFVMPKAAAPFDRRAEIYDSTIGWRFVNRRIEERYGIDSMPETAENLARERRISRQDQDAYALRSQQRTLAARELHAEEIAPIPTPGRKGQQVTVADDEHPRADTDLDSLARLGPITEGGTVTAGNSSGVNDGACAMLLASGPAVRRSGLTPIARIVAAASAAVPPRLMGIGPVPASRKVLERAGLTLNQMDVIELNEAFAAQVLAVTRELGLPDAAEHLNPNGGAIALGHPLGMSGARLILTAALELRRRKGRYALVTLCVGVGQGASLVLESAK